MSLFGSITNLITGGSGAAAKAGGNAISAGQNWLNNIYQTTATQENPFITNGTTANQTLSDILNGGNTNAMQPFFNSSVYQFPLQQGLQAVNNNQAALGLSNSTGALKNAAGFTEGFASQNFQSFINNLMGLNSSGQQGISTQAQTGTGVAPSYTNLTGQGANAAGASAAAPWAAGSSLLGNVGSIIGSLF